MTKTVFVIGAGAGFDFDMPLGADLVRAIAELLRGVEPRTMQGRSGDFWTCVRVWLESEGRGFDQNIVNAIMRLSRAIHFAKSIDTLINDAKDPDVKAIGKIAISYVLGQAEKTVPFLYDTGVKSIMDVLENTIRSTGPLKEIDTFSAKQFKSSQIGDKKIKISFSETWFTAFFRELRAGLSVEEFQHRLSHVTVVNFNYDRLLEYFLLLAIRQYDGVSFSVAQSWLSKMTHIHPYGTLADPAQYVADRQDSGVPIGMFTPENNANSPKNIRTFDEGVLKENHKIISKAVSRAKKLILLGYGFHKQNNTLLGLADMESTQFWASGVGLSTEQRNFITTKVIGVNSFFPDTNSIRLEEIDCRTLIDYFGSDFF